MAVSPALPFGNKFFTSLPDDATRTVFEYLRGDDSTISNIDLVCTDWQKENSLQAERQAVITRLQSVYPQSLVQLFRRCATPIERLPPLALPHAGHTHASFVLRKDYLERYIRPQEMAQPVMRLQHPDEPPGIVLRVQVAPSVQRRQYLSCMLESMRNACNFLLDGNIERTQACIQGLWNTTQMLVEHWNQHEEDALVLFQSQANNNRFMSLTKHCNIGSALSESDRWPAGDLPSEAFLQRLLSGTHPRLTLPGHPTRPARSVGLSTQTVLTMAVVLVAGFVFGKICNHLST